MYLVINKWVIAVKASNFSGHYLRNRSTLDIGVLGYIGIVWPKEHSPEVWHIPPGTPCIYTYVCVCVYARYLTKHNLDPLQVNAASVTPTQNICSSSTLFLLIVGTRKYGVGVYSITTRCKVQILQ